MRSPPRRSTPSVKSHALAAALLALALVAPSARAQGSSDGAPSNAGPAGTVPSSSGPDGAAALSTSGPNGAGAVRDDARRGARVRTREDDTGNPLRGSTLTFDQSMTTQTAHLEPSPQQSYVPLYEIWLSLRPRYYFNEHLSLRGRFDYTKELTNQQSTTYYREDVFGDIWTDLVYGSKLDALWQGTKASVGLRALWPTSKVSQANGTYVTLGVTAAASHKFEINGESAPVLDNFHVGLTGAYLHPFTNSTTSNTSNFSYVRQDVDGFSFISNQVQGQMLVQHTVWGILDTGLQITPKLALTADMIFINQWHYTPKPTTLTTSDGTKVTVGNPGDNQFTQNLWFLTNLDYALFDELDLGVGYYNLANAIAPDGQRRGVFGSDNIWWSPDARVFFDVTANLDALFDDASHHRYTRAATAQAAQTARQQRLANELR
jgi:hypothetical protein